MLGVVDEQRVYMALIFGLCSMSHPPVPDLHFESSDKLLHAILYGGFGLTLLWGQTDASRRTPGWKTVVITTFVALLYGVTDEFHQRFVPGRSFEIGDMIADMVGGFLAGGSVWAWWSSAPAGSPAALIRWTRRGEE